MEQRVDTPKEVVNPTQRRPRGSGIVWLVVLALLAAGVYWWSHRQQPAERQTPAVNRRAAPPASVGTAVIGTGSIDIALDALGTVTSLATITVRTQISGQLVKVAFTEGQETKKGDLLAQIDPRPYEAALAQAKGQLARDQATLQGAQVDLKRYQQLAAQNAVQRQTLDTQVALVAQYQGTVEADQAAVKAAEVNLAFTSIAAPVDGRVGLRQVDQGNYITPTDTNGIVVITQLLPISVLFTVPEDQLPAIRQRMAGGVTLPVTAFDRTGNTKLADGKLETFDSSIDPTTGTIKLRAIFPNDNHALYPNQFVNVELLVDRHENVVIAPTPAIQRGSPGTFVYVVNADSTVSVRKVTLGPTNGERVEIRDGLKAGETVVVDGIDRLRDGARINVHTDTTAPAQAAAPQTAPTQTAPAQTAPTQPAAPNATPRVPGSGQGNGQGPGQGGGRRNQGGQNQGGQSP
ncbi:MULTISPECIES: MdtA/MuxA family multidrug efflux RND transporter periplasmic adaptor subunit [unclassified Beijerinckia]|uniref:MdtA/MuxA family multidrug efflux RND transporter periplasmic adaptor subunit n=1 Tax=unclassified Beijerinckia TaxID=2638183 RepID=UPI000898F677|nr:MULTISPECIES: MdtA/MuxA family multidrug efflux RND transporter periplasmic adaptor subunit [unclassified Beijerinckia]MDH7797108.1 multidrug efflux system membrane fusion protein [Beijerinckia sp. GAS462]SEC72534.1 membrane fusion protein, multidrug efflux system [Beijerinckia sp. 28-YEA-48]